MIIRTVKSQDVFQVMSFVANIFTRYEPLTKSLKITHSEFEHSFANVIAGCCESGISSIIYDDGKPISVSLALPHDVYKRCIYPDITSTKPLIGLLDELEKTVPINIKNTVYHLIVGTDLIRSNKGLGRACMTRTLRSSYYAGYDFIIADATSHISQNMLIKAGYSELGSLSYKDFQYEGKKPFAMLDEKRIVRMGKDIY
jgi:hypothetical protein